MRQLSTRLGVALAWPVLLGACTDRAADLQTRLTAAQEELAQAKAELANGSHGSDSAPVSFSVAAGNLPSAPEIERNYDRAVEDFRTELQRDLPGARDLNLTKYQPRVEDKPYHGEFTLEVNMGARPVRIQAIPVQAGLDGKWTFPTTAAVIEQIRRAPETAARVASAPEAPAAPPAAPSAPAALMPSNQTVTIAWPDAPGARSSSAPSRPQYAQPAPPVAPAPAPAAPAAPSRMMPTNRDVQIKF